jgi:hypothetical protein
MMRDLEAYRGKDDAELARRFFRVAQVELWASLHGF